MKIVIFYMAIVVSLSACDIGVKGRDPRNYPENPKGYTKVDVPTDHGNWFLKTFANNSANNILTEITTTGNDVTTYTYIYSSAGLPIKAVISKGQSFYKIHYYYTSL